MNLIWQYVTMQCFRKKIKICRIYYIIDAYAFDSFNKSFNGSSSYLILETKNQWARDDPAFVVICSLLLVVATLAYCAA